MSLRTHSLCIHLMSLVCLSMTPVGAWAQAHVDRPPCYVDGIADRLRCGSIEVAENPLQPEGRKIDIHYAVIPAINNIYPAEAFLAIAGGPGQSAIDSAPTFDATFANVRQTRDILLIDQRGTGRSNPLLCPEDTSVLPLQVDDRKFDAALETQNCLAQLQGDVKQYTSAIALADFEAVRVKLNYQKLHLYGISYGSRMAQLYMRRYPKALGTVTLDGVVPMQQSVLAIGLAIDRAMALLLAECADSDRCGEQFPNLAERLATVIAELDQSPAMLQVMHPTTGKPSKFFLTRNKFLGVLRLALYAPNTRSLLPLAIDRAAAGNYQPVLGLYSLTMNGLDLAIGMHNAVLCSEDIHRLTNDLTEQLGQSTIGTSMLEQMSDACAVWPANPVNDDFFKPIASAIPTLLLSGQQDPATPPEWAELAMSKMTNAVHWIAPHAAHGVAMQTCAGRLIAQFIDLGSTTEIDSECIQDGGAGGFYLNANALDRPATATALQPNTKESP